MLGAKCVEVLQGGFRVVRAGAAEDGEEGLLERGVVGRPSFVWRANVIDDSLKVAPGPFGEEGGAEPGIVALGFAKSDFAEQGLKVVVAEFSREGLDGGEGGVGVRRQGADFGDLAQGSFGSETSAARAFLPRGD